MRVLAARGVLEDKNMEVREQDCIRAMACYNLLQAMRDVQQSELYKHVLQVGDYAKVCTTCCEKNPTDFVCRVLLSRNLEKKKGESSTRGDCREVDHRQAQEFFFFFWKYSDFFWL